MYPEIIRPKPLRLLQQALGRSQVVAILGPPQCGKTTLARSLKVPATHYFDLERSADKTALAERAESTLAPLNGLVVIAEVPELPGLFATLRVSADHNPLPTRFLLLGSVAPSLLQGASETLAGRIEFIPLSGFTLDDIGPDKAEALWQRGGFPRAFLAANEDDCCSWRENFIATFRTRDAARLGIALSLEALRRFWIMLAHVHAGAVNYSDLARAMGLSQTTISRYIDILTVPNWTCCCCVAANASEWNSNSLMQMQDVLADL